jgi:hypothetical protein
MFEGDLFQIDTYRGKAQALCKHLNFFWEISEFIKKACLTRPSRDRRSRIKQAQAQFSEETP